MWPQLLDMTKEESIQSLRYLEVEAYASLVTALRAQGPLNAEKLKLLKETASALNIAPDRHKAEIRRAVNDEKLNTIAFHVSGQNGVSEDWAQEGRRLIPLMPRAAPQTAYSAIADHVADAASMNNKQLPHPANTERKRNQNQQTQNNVPDSNRSVQYRLTESPKLEESKKRKLPFVTENSSLSQHLMGPPKLSKIQQIYRQRTKARVKEQQLQMKVKQEQEQKDPLAIPHRTFSPANMQPIKLPLSPQPNLTNSTKTNTIPEEQTTSEQTRKNDANTQDVLAPQTSCSNENQAPKGKSIIVNNKLTQSLPPLKAISCPGPSGDIHKAIKICPRKTLTKSMSTGQKLLVVSNSQSTPTNSILQKTLTIPYVKNLSVKNFDKFKIVTTTTITNSLPVTPVTNNSSFNSNSVKHKVVTVRTNPTTKKLSLSHLQVLNAKGNIKVLPFGGKILSKTTTAPASNLFIMNTNDGLQTKSILTTPLMMAKQQEERKPLINDHTETSVPTYSIEAAVPRENKSSVLAEILEASGVTACDAYGDSNQSNLCNESMVVSQDSAFVDVNNMGKLGRVKSENGLEEETISVLRDVKNRGMEDVAVECTVVDDKSSVEVPIIKHEEETIMENILDDGSIPFSECVIGETVILPSDNMMCVEVANVDLPVECSTD